jgi:hypothetical protein
MQGVTFNDCNRKATVKGSWEHGQLQEYLEPKLFSARKLVIINGMNTNASTKRYNIIDNSVWKDKISNHHQFGGIETSILDNGIGKCTRIAWINTGTGLRFKVVLDRAMDIADAFYNQHSLAWISHFGVTRPDPSVNSGFNWLNSFGGGLLATCGLTHIGGPENDRYGERGLHDRISHFPATVESIIQPDLKNGNLEMSITGRMLQSTVFGPHLQLKRTISAKLGSAKIRIIDQVTNLGNEPAPHMLLYHFNFGWPLIDEGTEICWEGKWKSRGSNADNFIFKAGNDIKICKAPIVQHNGTGESVAFIDIESGPSGVCECAVWNRQIPLKVRLKFKKEQLPWLTNWQHWGKNEYVTALEPGTNPPIGQSVARKENTLLFLQPGEIKVYEIEMEVVQD